jgi:hypothetical protein
MNDNELYEYIDDNIYDEWWMMNISMIMMNIMNNDE